MRRHSGGMHRLVIWTVLLCFTVSWVERAEAARGGAADAAWGPCDDSAEFLPLPELIRTPRYAVHVRLGGTEDAGEGKGEGEGEGARTGAAAQEAPLETSRTAEGGQRVEIMQDGMRYLCSVPPYPPVLRSTYPLQEMRLKGPSESLLHKPLDREEMAEVEDLLSPMQHNCYFQTMESGRDSYLYEFCYGVSMRRGRMHRTGTREEDGKTVTFAADDSDAVFVQADVGVDWTGVEELGRRPGGLPQWGVVEADEQAFLTSGYSTFFYQWYGEALLLKMHCADNMGFLYINEVRSGQFEGAFGSPLVCRHPLIARADSFYADIDCTLQEGMPEKDTSAHSSEGADLSEMDGIWSIFEAANNPSHSYWGTVTFTTQTAHSWSVGKALLASCKERQLSLQGTAACEGPKLVQVDWQLEQVSYRGIGTVENDQVCAVWSTGELGAGPAFTSLRVLNNDTLEGFWWSPKFGHGVEMWYRIEDDDDSDEKKEHSSLEGQFSVLGIRESKTGEALSYSMLAAIKHSPVHDTYSVIWTAPGERLLGRGILSGNNFCIVFRAAPQANDGVVVFRKEGTHARGLWMLFYNKILQREDLVRVA